MIEKNHTVKNQAKFNFAFIYPDKRVPWKETDVGRIMTSGSSGKLKKRIIQLIDSANNQICACSFLLADSQIEDSLIKASKRGVRIYFLTSAEVKLKTSEGEDWGRDDEIRELHKKMLTKLVGNIYLRSSGHFHAKYIIVDKKKGLMTTCNFTTKALIENPEIGVELNKEECKQVWKLFQYQFWEDSEKEMLRQGTLDGVDNKSRFPEYKPNNGVRCSHPSGTESTILEESLSMIDSAKHSITLTSYGWGNNEISSAIKKKLKQGLDISIIGRNHRGPKQTNYLQEFKEMGCLVYGLPLIHAKSILIDSGYNSARGIVMSANFDNISMTSSHEIGICLDNNDCNKFAKIIEDWKKASLLLIEKKKHKSIEGKLSVFTDSAGWKDMLIENYRVSDYGSIDKSKPTFENSKNVVIRIHEHRWKIEKPNKED